MGLKTINKNVLALGWVSFFTDMASSIVNILLPIYIIYVLNEGVDKLGVVIAISTFISYIFRILFGYLSDKYSVSKPFVLIGYTISAFTKPLFSFANSFSNIALIQGAERMGKTVRSASRDVLISSYSTPKKHGKTFGFHKMMDIAGELTGAVIVFTIFLYYSKTQDFIKEIFSYTIIPGIIAICIVVLFVEEVPKVKKKTANKIICKEDFKLFPLLFVYFGFIFFIINQQFLLVYAKQNGFSLSEIPLLVILFTSIQTLTSYYGGVLNDKIGSFKMLIIAFIFGILSILSIKLNLWLAFSFLGLFTVLGINAIRSYISINAKSKGFLFGIFYGGVAIFSSLGALFSGYIWKYFDFNYLFQFSLIGMIILFFIFIYIRDEASTFQHDPYQ